MHAPLILGKLRDVFSPDTDLSPKPHLHILSCMESALHLHRLRGVEINGLSVFKVVTESGGFSQAAKFLGVDLSTISRQVKDIEIRLGFELCQRGRSGFSLTQNGRIVYDVACEMVSTLKVCDERLEGLRSGLSGTLRIGLVNHLLSAPELKFHEIIRRMRQQAPDLIVDCKIMSPSEIMRQVEDRHLHLGILGAMERLDQLEYIPIFNEEAGLFCGLGHSLFADSSGEFNDTKLRGMRYVGRTHNSHTDILAQSFGMIAETVSNDIDVIFALIQSGVYLGFIPIHAISALDPEKKVRRLPIAEGDCKVPFFVCTRKLPQQARRTKLFLKTLNAVMGTAAEP